MNDNILVKVCLYTSRTWIRKSETKFTLSSEVRDWFDNHDMYPYFSYEGQLWRSSNPGIVGLPSGFYDYELTFDREDDGSMKFPASGSIFEFNPEDEEKALLFKLTWG